MASTNLAAGDHGAYGHTLVANTADTITFGRDLDRVEVYSDGTAALYFTVDGTVPVVGASSTWELPAGAALSRDVAVPTSGHTVVRLISAGTPRYSVSEVA